MSRKERKINFSEFLAAGPEEAGLLIINTPISSKKGEQWAMTKVVFEVDDSIKLNSLCYDSWFGEIKFSQCAIPHNAIPCINIFYNSRQCYR